MEDVIAAYPLTWPIGWKRTESHRRARAPFEQTSVYREVHGERYGRSGILPELRRLGATNVVVSTNVALRNDGLPYSRQKPPSDPGVAVWFTLEGEQRVLACDRWDRVEHNLRAIVKHVDSIRGQARWGVGTVAQAFRGFRAIAETTGGRPWWIVLGFDPDPDNVASLDADDVQRGFRARALECHPDQGGTREAWDELNEARRQGLEAVS